MKKVLLVLLCFCVFQVDAQRTRKRRDETKEKETTNAHIPEAARGILGELTPELIIELDRYIKQRLL